MDPIQKRALSRSEKLEAVYLEALLYLNLSLMLLQKVFHNKMYRERQVLIEATTETMASTEVLWLGFNVKAEGKTSSSRDATKFPVYAI